MQTIPGTHIPLVDTENGKINTLINEMIFPTIMEFEQIIIHNETATITGERQLQFTYANWNEAYPVEVYLNGNRRQLAPAQFEVDYSAGRITLGFDLEQGDHVQATYCFNYFPLAVLEGFIRRAVTVANTAGTGVTTDYTAETVPEEWLGIIADLVTAMCMEKLILEYNLWKGRLLLAIPSDGLYTGSDETSGDNIVTLELVRKSAEARAYKSLNNQNLRTPNNPTGTVAD